MNVYIECGDSNWVYVVLRYGREGGGRARVDALVPGMS